jgi:hypothetical protein
MAMITSWSDPERVILSKPPFGMASTAFFSRLVSTCIIWSLSILAIGSLILFSTLYSDVVRMDDGVDAAFDKVYHVGLDQVYLVLTCKVQQSSHDAAATLRLLYDKLEVFVYRAVGRVSSFRILVYIVITPSGLFSSCAIPAESWPMLASFSDWRKACCVEASCSLEILRSFKGTVQLFDGIRQAHFIFRKSFYNGNSMVNTGVIPASAAVKLVFFRYFPHLKQHFFDFFA